MKQHLEPVSTREEVIFYDTDCGGVVSNIAYLRYVEKARCALFSSLGYDLQSMTGTGIFPTVVRTEIDYRKSAGLGENLIVEAAVESVRKLKIQCRFVISREEDSTVFAEASQTVVLVRMPEGKPVRPPREWK